MFELQMGIIYHSTIFKFISAHGAFGTGPLGNNITPERHLLNLKKKKLK